MEQKGENNKKWVEGMGGKLRRERGCWALKYNFEGFFKQYKNILETTPPTSVRPSPAISD
jgi:hypothetical protein